MTGRSAVTDLRPPPLGVDEYDLLFKHLPQIRDLLAHRGANAREKRGQSSLDGQDDSNGEQQQERDNKPDVRRAVENQLPPHDRHLRQKSSTLGASRRSQARQVVAALPAIRRVTFAEAQQLATGGEHRDRGDQNVDNREHRFTWRSPSRYPFHPATQFSPSSLTVSKRLRFQVSARRGVVTGEDSTASMWNHQTGSARRQGRNDSRELDVLRLARQHACALHDHRRIACVPTGQSEGGGIISPPSACC